MKIKPWGFIRRLFPVVKGEIDGPGTVRRCGVRFGGGLCGGGKDDIRRLL